jgi:hypothetical protein
VLNGAQIQVGVNVLHERPACGRMSEGPMPEVPDKVAAVGLDFRSHDLAQ